MSVVRRSVLLFTAAVVTASCRTPADGAGTALASRFAAIERDGRLGVAVLDTADGSVVGHRLDERFAMCSTFKLVLAAMVLDRAAAGGPPLDRCLAVGPGDLEPHSPFTRTAVEAAVARGAAAVQLTCAELAEAAQITSDNAAANVLLRDLGGPAAFTAFCRAHGDGVTRLDRYEPEMNEVRVGDVRDTTTPRAMAQLVAQLSGKALAPGPQRLLRQWMVATATGAARVRRGLPAAWVAGDKTGTGGGNGFTAKCNDVVWIEPPGRAPLVVAVYYDTGNVADWPTAADEEVLAEVGRIVAQTR